MADRPFKTLFDNAIVSTPDPAGDWAKTRGGADIPDGQKETPGEIGQGVTYADLDGAPTPGSSFTGGNEIANSKESGVAGK